MNRIVVAACLVTSSALLSACEKKADLSKPKASGDHTHAPDGSHTPAPAGHGGPVIQLGTSTIGPFTAKATRDQGDIVAGKDAPIDVTVTAAAGQTVNAIAVRFWIGTADGRTSVKALAEIEDPSDPNRWHTHAEIPNPLPEGSQLWVEIEAEGGKTFVGSFDLDA